MRMHAWQERIGSCEFSLGVECGGQGAKGERSRIGMHYVIGMRLNSGNVACTCPLAEFQTRTSEHIHQK
jgi:hypothetical protein